MRISAPAKINLGLRILRKRTDGFHDLDTVFLRIGWADELRYEPAPSDTMTCSDASLPTDAGNLCMQALEAVRSVAAGLQDGGIRIHLDKKVPYGAGLGGGSADAAVCLRAVNELLEAGLSEVDLHRLASALGSDVPFFLVESGVARGTGRGEVLSPLSFPSALRNTWLVVVVPPVHISTAEAYRGVRPDDANSGDLAELVLHGSLNDWKTDLVNDFESHLFANHPELADLKTDLLEAGAGYAAMSGSGSAVFGVFATEKAALDAVFGLDADAQTWVGRSDAAVNRPN